MAGGNYLRCEVCSCKTVYSGDLDWPDGVTIITYCAEHDPEAANPAPARACVDREELLAEIDRRIAAADPVKQHDSYVLYNQAHAAGRQQELRELRAHIEALVTGGRDGAE